jgi:mono/diheme cytochrome c family protein
MKMIAAAFAVVVASLPGCGAPKEPAPGQPAPVASGWTMPTPEQGYNVREGKSLYRYYCLTCHGDEGHGDGLNAYNLDPKPRDLADPAFQAKKTDDELAAVVQSGGGAAGLSTAMPPWGRTLSSRQVRNIVRYLRVLAAPPTPPQAPPSAP